MKIFVANLIWRIVRLGPNIGNLVMDISEKAYDFAMDNNTLLPKKG